ncbi:GPP34 family phosphoprotein [Nocardioides sp. SR21]|uniref:GOLPH3/VPS74 family protein n=1 Tax=Nocardioides sp. SR21 TaxID=2919501 RepID=UPI001FAA160A|nr:GPP34 family phosphoprotein [Nocardioides sp. SR21]
METLISEDLLLLVLDDTKGAVTGTINLPAALGGAVLTELALIGAVEVQEKAGMWSTAKVRTVADARPEDPTLAAAYDVVAERPRTAQDLVTRLGKNRRDELADRLVARGILARQDTKVLGLFPTKRWPTVEPGHERAVRYRLTAALVQGVEPDERTAALIALLSAVDRAHKVVDHDGVPAKVVRKRAKEISEGAWAAKAVKDAISAATAAVAAVAVAGAVAASSAS